MTDTERVKPRALAVEEAIALALESRWAEAVTVNERFIETHGPDEDACNRLGKALSETGRIEDAIAAYRQTLELNPLNIIAPKMLRKLTALQSAPAAVGGNAAIDVDLFTEEPGKSGITALSVPADTAVGAVSPGDVVELAADGDRLHAVTARGIDLGHVESKLARRLLPLLATGNRYEAAVARVEGERIEVIIRETYQSPENARRTSFAIARGARRDDFRPYAKESLLAGRDVDDDGLDLDEHDAGVPDTSADEASDGLQTIDGALDDVSDSFDDDAADDDARPEDSY